MLISLRSVLVAVLVLLNQTESVLALQQPFSRRLKKVLELNALSTFFVSVCLWSYQVQAQESLACDFLTPLSGRPVALERVVDGDTVILRGGERLRLSGINTPELLHPRQGEEPVARKAKEYLSQLLSGSEDWYVINPISDTGSSFKSRDGHGRLLGHLVSVSQGSAEVLLLRRGLAFAVAVESDRHMACFRSYESSAKAERLGVWAQGYWDVRRVQGISDDRLGFGRFSGEITKVDLGETIYIEVDDHLVLVLSGEARGLLDYRGVLGREISFSGWVSKRNLSEVLVNLGRKPYVARLKSPYMVIIGRNR